MRFVATIDFTSQGMASIKQTTQRASAFQTTAKQMGVDIRELLWTQGAYDGVLLFDAPNDQVAAALMLNLGRAGNVQTKTCRAFDAAEMDEILATSG